MSCFTYFSYQVSSTRLALPKAIDYQNLVNASQYVTTFELLADCAQLYRYAWQRIVGMEILLFVSFTIATALTQANVLDSAIHLRLLLWTCSSNCDYVCQHIITERRVSSIPPMSSPVLQYHGKWPFYRIFGVQEPCSVLFSLLNFLAHRDGLSRIYDSIPADYSLRKYYVMFSYMGLASWLFSMIFHTRDFNLTERLDYFAAGASVLYGFYYAPIRVFRLDQKTPVIKNTLLRLWTTICVLLYVAHVTYLTLWRWDYTYNMAANVTVGVIQNIIWSWFSVKRYQRLRKPWAAWPGLIFAWIVMAMSFELLDFPPIKGMVDAHSLWHLGTVGPTIWWYK